MARERRGFHLTPDGPKPCTAKAGNCPYGEHFTTAVNADIAFKNYAKAAEKEAIRQELTAAIRDWNGPEVLKINNETKILNNHATARRFAMLASAHEHNLGQDPKNISVWATDKLTGPEGDWYFRISRHPEVDADILKIKGKWSVEWWHSKDFGSSDPALEDSIRLGVPTSKRYYRHSFAMGDERTTLASFYDFHQKVADTVGTHSYFNAPRSTSYSPTLEEAIENGRLAVRKYTKRYTDLIRAVESESMGAYQASLHGIGPYDAQINDGGDMEINATFLNSSFSGRSLEKMAADKEFFINGPVLLPDSTTIAVTHEGLKGESWTMNHTPYEGWSIDLHTDKSAQGVRYPVSSPEDAQHILWNWLRDNYGEEEANTRNRFEGVYVRDLVAGGDNAFSIYQTMIDNNLQEQYLATASHRAAFLADEEDEKGVFGKIFSLFG